MSGPPRIFDRLAIARARTRAELRKDDAFLVREAADGLVARLEPIQRKFEKAVDIDGHLLARQLLRPFARDWSDIQISEQEDLPVAVAEFDLATSVLSLHSTNDLPGLLIQTRRALRPDGVFAAALFGGDTLQELRRALAAAEVETRGGASPRVAPFADLRDIGHLLQRVGFALPVTDVERTTVLYDNLSKLVGDLRTNGQTNVLRERSRRPMSRDTLRATEEHYQQNFSDKGRLRATFDIVYFIGWAPADSQPKALKPGSAKVTLASVLRPRER